MSEATSITVYGIPNCDTVKKARRWLQDHGVAHAFHDYKKAGADSALLAAWAAEAGWSALLNRKGTSFRKLDEADRAGLDEARALALMAAQPSQIRRPVVTGAGPLVIGFDPEHYARRFAATNAGDTL